MKNGFIEEHGVILRYRILVLYALFLVVISSIGMEEIVRRTGEKAKVSSVLLLTDGLANVGITNREGILDEMKKIIDPKPGQQVISPSINWSTMK